MTANSRSEMPCLVKKDFQKEKMDEFLNEAQIFSCGVKNKNMCNTLYERFGERIFSKIDECGNSVLHWAALNGDLSIITMVMSAGSVQNPTHLNGANIVNLNEITKNNKKSHPIHWACYIGHLHVVELFLSFGVDINVLDSKNNSPQMIAIQNNHVSLAMYLSSKGADTNIVDCNGDNCLHWSAYTGNLKLVKYFIEENHMLPTKKDNFNQNCLHLACLNGNVELIKYLVEQVKLDYLECDNKGQNCLDIVKNKKHLRALEYLQRLPQSFENSEINTNASQIMNNSEAQFSMGTFLGNARNIFLTKSKNLDPLSRENSGIEAVVLTFKTIFWLNCVLALVFICVQRNGFNYNIAFYLSSIINFIFMVLFFIKLSRIKNDISNENSKDVSEESLKEISIQNDYTIDSINEPQICEDCCTIQPINCEHCFICGKCVLEKKFHEYMFGKCITDKSIGIYLAFAFHRLSLYITMISVYIYEYAWSYVLYNWFYGSFLVVFTFLYTYSFLSTVEKVIGRTMLKILAPNIAAKEYSTNRKNAIIKTKGIKKFLIKDIFSAYKSLFLLRF